jgi:hypothetical protein
MQRHVLFLLFRGRQRIGTTARENDRNAMHAQNQLLAMAKLFNATTTRDRIE